MISGRFLSAETGQFNPSENSSTAAAVGYSFSLLKLNPRRLKQRMHIRDVMTQNVEYVPTHTSLKAAAEIMERLDAGFLPIGNSEHDKLRGVVTDRDIAIRGVGKGLDPNSATVEDVMTDKVLYCLEDDSLENAARNMGDQKVYRLIVLNNEQDKKMTGVVSLADIARRSEEKLAGQVTINITA